jgi:phosphinothricin acetyltransferase
VIVRPARSSDAGALAAIYAPFVSASHVSLEESPPGAAEIAERMEAGGPLYPWLVAETDGGVIGYASTARFRPRQGYRFSVETSVYVASQHQRRGVGRELYGALFRLLIGQGFTQAIASVTLPNPASVGLHETLGFQQCGTYRQVGWKLGRWWDVGLFQRTLAPALTPPEEPLGFADAIGNR